MLIVMFQKECWSLKVLCVGQVERLEGLDRGQLRARLGPVPEGALITLHGTGVDLSPEWRHAGALALPQISCGFQTHSP